MLRLLEKPQDPKEAIKLAMQIHAYAQSSAMARLDYEESDAEQRAAPFNLYE